MSSDLKDESREGQAYNVKYSPHAERHVTIRPVNVGEQQVHICRPEDKLTGRGRSNAGDRLCCATLQRGEACRCEQANVDRLVDASGCSADRLSKCVPLLILTLNTYRKNGIMVHVIKS